MLQPPLLAANGNQGVMSLSTSQSTRNEALVGGDARNVSPLPCDEERPTVPCPLSGTRIIQ